MFFSLSSIHPSLGETRRPTNPTKPPFQPNVRSFESQSPALAFLAVILATIGISDLVTLSLPDDMPEHHWGMQGMFSPVLYVA